MFRSAKISAFNWKGCESTRKVSIKWLNDSPCGEGSGKMLRI
jgi:hypothetical protein